MRQAAKSGEAHGLPKVSVIITNYNYGAFLEEALSSVAAQTYPNVEVVIVDDSSTDNSWQLIQDLTVATGPFPQMKAVKLAENQGHGLAAAAGLKRTTGPYVILMDADDFFLPKCLEAHIYAHLSSRVPIGFSSVDTYTLTEKQYVTTTFGTDRNAYISSGVGRLPNMTRNIELAARSGWFGSREPVIASSDLHLVPAPHCEWVWAPMSGNCFRRSAIDLVLGDTGMDAIRSSTDNYFMYPIAALCGSMLIDKPLMAYRIHSTNTFIRSAPLARLLTYSPDPKAISTRKASVRKTFEIVGRAGNIFEQPDFFFEAVAAQCNVWPELICEEDQTTFLVTSLFRFEDVLVKAFGESTFLDWLERCGIQRRQVGRARRRITTNESALSVRPVTFGASEKV